MPQLLVPRLLCMLVPVWHQSIHPPNCLAPTAIWRAVKPARMRTSHAQQDCPRRASGCHSCIDRIIRRLQPFEGSKRLRTSWRAPRNECLCPAARRECSTPWAAARPSTGWIVKAAGTPAPTRLCKLRAGRAPPPLTPTHSCRSPTIHSFLPCLACRHPNGEWRCRCAPDGVPSEKQRPTMQCGVLYHRLVLCAGVHPLPVQLPVQP